MCYELLKDVMTIRDILIDYLIDVVNPLKKCFIELTELHNLLDVTRVKLTADEVEKIRNIVNLKGERETDWKITEIDAGTNDIKIGFYNGKRYENIYVVRYSSSLPNLIQFRDVVIPIIQRYLQRDKEYLSKEAKKLTDKALSNEVKAWAIKKGVKIK